MSEKPSSWVPYAQPLLDAVMMFEELAIGYALVGGIAAMYYGRARFTEDVDFVAVTGHMDVLAKHPEVMTKFHFDSTCTYKLHHQSGVQIDLWNDAHSADIVDRSVEIELADQEIRIAEPHDLIAMKLRVHRLKDDYDVAQIASAVPIDVAKLQSLLTTEQLQAFHGIMKRV